MLQQNQTSAEIARQRLNSIRAIIQSIEGSADLHWSKQRIEDVLDNIKLFYTTQLQDLDELVYDLEKFVNVLIDENNELEQENE